MVPRNDARAVNAAPDRPLTRTDDRGLTAAEYDAIYLLASVDQDVIAAPSRVCFRRTGSHMGWNLSDVTEGARALREAGKPRLADRLLAIVAPKAPKARGGRR